MDFLLIVIIIQVLIFGSGVDALGQPQPVRVAHRAGPAGAPAQLKARAPLKAQSRGVSSAGRASRG